MERGRKMTEENPEVQMTEHEKHNLQSWKHERRKNMYFSEIDNLVKEEKCKF